MKLTFNQWVFMKVFPKMACKPMANGTFFLVPWDHAVQGREIYWQYALVNIDMKMHKMLFKTEDEAIDALFDANEIWYGNSRYPNYLFNRKYEMLVEYDLACQES